MAGDGLVPAAVPGQEALVDPEPGPGVVGPDPFTSRWARTRLSATSTRAAIQAGRTATTARP